MQFVDEISFVRECLRILCATPEDDRTRIKQKNCAGLVLQCITGLENKKVVKDYVDLLKHVCDELVSSNGTLSGSVLVNNIDLNEYASIKDEVQRYTQEVVSEQVIVDFINFLDLKIKAQTVSRMMDETITEVAKIKSEVSLTKTIHDFERLIQRQYIRLLQLKETEDSILNEVVLSAQSGSEMLQQIIQKLSRISQSRPRLTSGFHGLDDFLRGGFEATRIYVFGGKPGLGKSTLMINFIVNTARSYKASETEKTPALIYVTLENDMVETIERLLACLNERPVDLSRLTGLDIEKISQPYLELDIDIICEHMKPHATTTMDIFLLLDKLSTTYKIVGVIVDYLNLVTATTVKYSEKRHELGAVTSELKSIGKQFQCPVLVPAQLNTEGYEGIPTMRNLDESRQIAQNADFVGLMFEVPEAAIPPELQYKYGSSCDFVGINVDKNRSGKRGLYVLLGLKNKFVFKDLPHSEREGIIAGLRQLRSKRRTETELNGLNQSTPLKQTISDPYKGLLEQNNNSSNDEGWQPI